MPPLITITGAAGKVGSAATRRLLQRGTRVRAITRHPEKLSKLKGAGVDVRPGDLADPSGIAQIFRGSDAILAMVPGNYTAPDVRADQRRSLAGLVEAIKASGVRRVVAISSLGAERGSGTGPVVALHEFEEALKKIPGLSLIVLRAAYFMDNQLASIPIIKMIGMNGGAVRADLSMPFIASKDVGVAAAEALAKPDFKGYSMRELLGPREYTTREGTSVIGAAIDMPELRYMEFSYDDLRRGLLKAGVSESGADIIAELQRGINDGLLESTQGRNQASTTPTTFEVFAREIFAPAFRAAS